ncbi:hypothetical protein P7C73_g3885, partial [Tremellales sp. Uapishka_1]
MPVKEFSTPYPLIDSDPHAGRVVRYMRSSDYALWAGATVAGPGLLYLYGMSSSSLLIRCMLMSMDIIEKADPTRYRFGIAPALRLTGFLGFCAGFMLAYQQSSFRFMGFRENAAEVVKDQQELSARAAAGKPLYGEGDLSPYIQGVASRNSTWSQLKFAAMPWFNFVNHNNHGVDTSKYTNASS